MATGDSRAGRRPAAPSSTRAKGGPQTVRRTSGTTPKVAVPSDPAARPPVPRRVPVRPHLTGRAAVLLVVVAALAVTLAWPARALVDQRRTIAGLRAGNAAAEQRVIELQKSLNRWDDPAYIEAQARARLHFVRPGETAYVVVGPDAAPAPVTPRVFAPVKEAWYDTLWQSVEGAASDAG